MIRNLVNEHLNDVDFDHPRDFIDVYLKEIHQTGDSFDIEQLVVVCLDFLKQDQKQQGNIFFLH